jgi:hypothetical protein
MSRTKKPSKLSADERAFLDRIRSLNEEETERLTVEEIIADLNIMDKIERPHACRLRNCVEPGSFQRTDARRAAWGR